MRTARILTISRHILHTPPGNHAHPPATTHAPQQPCTPPATMHAPPQPRMPPATPRPHMLPAMHTSWPCTPPTMHTSPSHAHTPPCTPSRPHMWTSITPRPCTPPWTEWQTGVKILPCPKLRLWAVKMVARKSHEGLLEISFTWVRTVNCSSK